jgi:ubiquinone biosynthesis protein
MEYIDGITVNKLISICADKNSEEYKKEVLDKGWDIRDINHRINLMQIKTVFVDGFFNADPHPANIIITDDKKVYYIDFGLVGRLKEKERIAIFRFLRGMATLDKDASYDSVKILFDTSKINNEDKLQEAFDKLFYDLAVAREKNNRSYAKTSTDSMLRFLKVVYNMNIQVPREVGKAFRFILTSDSIQHALVPDASIEEATKDLFQASLAATYIEFKKCLRKDKMTKIVTKFINYFEKEIFLD